MPRQPAGITKSKRIQTLRHVLQRWGRLNKDQIDNHVAANIGCDIASIARALYRDLDELIQIGEVVVYHFTRDGREIEDYDPEVHRNTLSEWALLGSESKVLGESILNSVGGQFFASPRLNRDYKLEDGTGSTDFRTLHIFFNLGQQFLCLKLNSEALPAVLVIGRNINTQGYIAPIQGVQKSFGKRASLLLVPVPNVTGSKDAYHLGHLALKFDALGLVSVTDLESKNGTSCYKLTLEDADRLRRSGSILDDRTVTSSWNSVKANVSKAIQLKGNVSQAFPTPLLIEASDRFRLLVI